MPKKTTIPKKKILRWDDPLYEQMRLKRYKQEKISNVLDQNVIQNQSFYTQTLKPKDALFLSQTTQLNNNPQNKKLIYDELPPQVNAFDYSNLKMSVNEQDKLNEQYAIPTKPKIRDYTDRAPNFEYKDTQVYLESLWQKLNNIISLNANNDNLVKLDVYE